MSFNHIIEFEQNTFSKRNKFRDLREKKDDREKRRKMPFLKFCVLVNLHDDDEEVNEEPERQTEKIEVIDLMVVNEDVAKPSLITEDEKIIETAKSIIPEINDDVLRIIFKHVIDDIFENILKDENVGKEAGSIMCTDRRFNIIFTEVFFDELDYYVKKMRVFETVLLSQTENEVTSEINDIENTEPLESLPEIKKMYRSEFLLRVMTKNKSLENIFLKDKYQAATEYINMILEDIMIRDDFDSHIFAMIKKVFSLGALEKNRLQDMLRNKYQEKVTYEIDVINLLNLCCVVNNFIRLLHDLRPEDLYFDFIESGLLRELYNNFQKDYEKPLIAKKFIDSVISYLDTTL
ncbi:1336_t:CDS:1, partial [Cetraspora pellucida]